MIINKTPKLKIDQLIYYDLTEKGGEYLCSSNHFCSSVIEFPVVRLSVVLGDKGYVFDFDCLIKHKWVHLAFKTKEKPSDDEFSKILVSCYEHFNKKVQNG